MKSRSGLRTRWLGCSLLLVAGLALPAVVLGQVAYTTQAVNVRAGPDREYPQVAWLPGGAPVTVAGCVDGYRWCDVVAGPNRGWVYAKFLSYPYQNRPVPIITGGAILGLPLITFSVGPYWDNYYRGRPWYGNRNYWYNRPTPYYRAPSPVYRPPPQHYRPPPAYVPPSSRPPGYGSPPYRPPGYVRPDDGRPPGGRPPPNTGQAPGGRPPSSSPPPAYGRPAGTDPPPPPVPYTNPQQ